MLFPILSCSAGDVSSLQTNCGIDHRETSRLKWNEIKASGKNSTKQAENEASNNTRRTVGALRLKNLAGQCALQVEEIKCGKRNGKERTQLLQGFTTQILILRHGFRAALPQMVRQRRCWQSLPPAQTLQEWTKPTPFKFLFLCVFYVVVRALATSYNR